MPYTLDDCDPEGWSGAPSPSMLHGCKVRTYELPLRNLYHQMSPAFGWTFPGWSLATAEAIEIAKLAHTVQHPVLSLSSTTLAPTTLLQVFSNDWPRRAVSQSKLKEASVGTAGRFGGLVDDWLNAPEPAPGPRKCWCLCRDAGPTAWYGHSGMPPTLTTIVGASTSRHWPFASDYLNPQAGSKARSKSTCD